MKIIFTALFTLLGLSAILASGCSSLGGNSLPSKQYDYKDFASLEINSGINYEITQTASYGIVVTGPQSVIDQMDIFQSGKKLTVALKPGSNNGKPKVTITLPVLNSLLVTSAARGTVTGLVSTSLFDLKVEGASHCDISGSADKANIVVAGASEVKGSNFQVQDAEVNVSGSSTATIGTPGTLDAEVTGTSTLNYIGNPVLGVTNVAGLSKMNRK